jgi:hypothetical protein
LPSDTTADWQDGYGMLDETRQRISGFTPLPHFTLVLLGRAAQNGRMQTLAGSS